MADVTDEAFRLIITKYGKPDILWTEFTSADGLCNPDGRKALKVNLLFAPKERPIVAQLFSSNPERMREAAKYAASLGFDGIDINMGCPDRKIEKSGAGAALIKNPKLAREIIRAAKTGAPNLPVSVKTRLGYNVDELEKWLPEILAEEPVAVTIHARTRKEMSEVPAHWDRVKRAVDIRNEKGSRALILGNGDALDLKDANEKAKDSGADGIMLGRAIFGNPWLFDSKKRSVSTKEKLTVMAEHARLFEKLFKRKNFAIMKKHFKAYCSGFDGAKELRSNLMETKNSKEVTAIVKKYLKS
jgi:nifR3 family TIM-barrel protein